MKIAAKIVNKLTVVTAVYQNADEYELSTMTCVRRGNKLELTQADLAEEGKYPRNRPLLVLIGGHGVIIKDADLDSEQAARVASEPERFIWNYRDGKLLFARRTQTDRLMTRLEGAGARIIGVECFDAGNDDLHNAVIPIVAELYDTTVTMRNVLRPTRSGSVVAQAMFHRLKMPVLAAALLLLTVNFFVGRSVAGEYAVQHRELTVLRGTIGRHSDSSRIRKETVSDFARSLPYSYSLLCDRIAGAVPERVVLTGLSLQPQLKALEEGRKPVLAEREIVLRGESPGPGEIGDFIAALQELGMDFQIRLTSVDKSRETGQTVFRINMGL